MNLYVLDTDHVSLFQRGHPHITAKVLATSADLLSVAIITVEEQFRGRLSQIRKARSETALVQAYARLHEMLQYFASICVLDYKADADARYQSLRRQQIRIGTQDLRIASVALSENATLVTRNQRDFGQVPGLSIEDWSGS